MRWSKKHGEKQEQVRKDKKGAAKLEPLRPKRADSAACKTLQREQNKAQMYLDIAGVMFVVLDSTGKVTLINRKGCEILGHSEQEIVGRNWFDNFLPERERTRVKRVFTQLMAGKIEPAEYFENPVLTKNGSEKLMAWRNTVLRDRDGNIAGAVSSGENITERKRAEEALRESEYRFRSLFEQAADAIVVFEPQTQEMVEFNDKAREMLGYTREEFAQLKIADVEAMESKEEVAAHIDKIARQGSDTFETKQRKKDGTLCYVLVSAKLITMAGKQYIQGIWRDITQLKKVEEKLFEYQKQLKRLASQLALAEERERRRIAGELHDHIGQSLALAKIKLDVLHASTNSQPVIHALEDVIGSLEKAILETRTLTFDLSSPILYELGFEAAVAEWLNEEVHEKHGIATEFQDDGLPKPLDDDVRVLLFRNVRELLINCIKHTRAGKVRVCVRRTDGSIEVTVEDNGIGFDPMEIRSMTAKRTEFGLFSVCESLEELGGCFEIESKPGAGCKATMTAPLKRKLHKKEG